MKTVGSNLILTLVLILFGKNIAAQNDTSLIVSAFFGLDNALPFQVNALCLGGMGMDGMPVNFRYNIDPSTIDVTDFEVIDSLGNTYTPICATLAPAGEAGESRTVLIIGEFGNDATNPPVEVRIVDELLTLGTDPEQSLCTEVIDLNGRYTRNVTPLLAPPSMFFAQILTGSLSECSGAAIQTVQVIWDGGVVPYINVAEEDLYQYYTVYTDSAGALVAHTPIAIADINDNDNYHQLCVATADSIVKISIVANILEDPNGDPNDYSEVYVSYCKAAPDSVTEPTPTSLAELADLAGLKVFPNPFDELLTIQGLSGDETLVIRNAMGQQVYQGSHVRSISTTNYPAGIYFLEVLSDDRREVVKLVKR